MNKRVVLVLLPLLLIGGGLLVFMKWNSKAISAPKKRPDLPVPAEVKLEGEERFLVNFKEGQWGEDIDDMPKFDIFDDTLYYIKNNLVLKACLLTGKVQQDNKLTVFMHKVASNEGERRQIIARNGDLYIAHHDKIFQADAQGEVKNVFSTETGIKHFTVLENDNVLVVNDRDQLELFDPNAARINHTNSQTHFTSYFFGNEKGLYHWDDEFYEYHLSPLAEPDIDERPAITAELEKQYPAISWVGDNYYLAYPYGKRDKVFVINKYSGDLEKTVDLSEYYLTPSRHVVVKEGGKPLFAIDESNGYHYVVCIDKRKLRVVRFDVG